MGGGLVSEGLNAVEWGRVTRLGWAGLVPHLDLLPELQVVVRRQLARVEPPNEAWVVGGLAWGLGQGCWGWWRSRGLARDGEGWRRDGMVREGWCNCTVEMSW